MKLLYNGDALEILRTLDDNSIHLVITDPPYFIDSMGDEWKKDRIANDRTKGQVVSSLPSGMKFDPAQGIRFQEFMEEISKEIFRVLKPGAFYLSFSQARLYHRLGIAVENAGFEIRDMLGWKYEGQAKAFSQEHFVNKMRISDEQKDLILKKLNGRKTPQLKPQIEPIVLAQKPRQGTFVENWLEHETGLIDVSHSLDGKFPGNIIEVPKPSKVERGDGNDHPTVKPVALISHLINIFSVEGQTVLDPFMGSGSHGIAALNCKRNFIGIERDKHYFDICEKRIK